MLLCVIAILASSGADLCIILVNKVMIAEGERLIIKPVETDVWGLLTDIAWFVGFSIGLLGVILTVLNLIRNRVRTVKNFCSMKELTPEEHVALCQWIDKGEYVRNVSALWAKEDDDD
jgi:hypothetical protein